MQKWLHDNDILMYLTHKSIVAERFIRTLKDRMYKRITTNDSKFYLSYLNKLVDQYNNTYHCSIGKRSIDADYSDFIEENEWSYKASKFKVGDSKCY